MGLPTNETLQGIAHSLRLYADVTAPTELTDEQKRDITEHPRIQQLAEKNRELTKLINDNGYPTISAAYGTPLYWKKMKVQSKLNRKKIRLRTKLFDRARKRHFRSADTKEFNRQINGAESTSHDDPPPPPDLQIAERREIVQLTCTLGVVLTDEERFTRRCESITLWVKLQGRKEPQRRGRHKKQQPSPQIVKPTSPMVLIHSKGTVPEQLNEN